jgi:hypothetical protein
LKRFENVKHVLVGEELEVKKRNEGRDTKGKKKVITISGMMTKHMNKHEQSE